MKTLSVIVPFYNEEATIGGLVSELSELPSGVISNCIFVDDGSSDKSLDILSRALERTTLNYKVVRKSNGGKASAVREGSKHLNSSHVVIVDADLELKTSDILVLWNAVESHKSDYVFGYRRFLAHSSFTWRYSRGNQILSNLYGVLFNEVITDIMCGYKLIPATALRNLPFRLTKFGLEIEIPMTMWKLGIRPYEIEVSYVARNRKQGKSISVKDALQIIISMIWFRIANRRLQ